MLKASTPVCPGVTAVNWFQGIPWYESWQLLERVYLLIYDIEFYHISIIKTIYWVYIEFHVCRDLIFVK